MPNVRAVIGNVIIVNIGLTKKFTNDNTTAETKAVKKLLMCIPGKAELAK